MNKRIKDLREKSLAAVNRISVERGLLVTDFYKSGKAMGDSVPVQRAKCLHHILTNKHICIHPRELIIGERGPAPKATPTYPEINVHSLEDLMILDEREKVSFRVDAETKAAYANVIIPFWQGQSNRDRVMNAMTQEWKDAYGAGIFTEFQEQRAPGHTVAGRKIWKKGMRDLIADIEESKSLIDPLIDMDAYDKIQELEAMKIAAEALILWSKRHVVKLTSLAEESGAEEKRKEYLALAEICKRVPEHAPRNFHEALQHYWFIHLGVVTELNPWDSFNPGRLDQHLYPFYMKGIKDGTLTKERATELLQSFWIKFNNHPAPPKVGVTAQESNTYTDFCLINLGGVKEDGSDAVNELTYIILDVIEEMRLLQPSSMVQLSKKNPDRFIDRAIKIVKTGFGQPSIFNTDAIIQELIRQGKDIVDARNGGASGCVESGAFGREAYFLSGYFNIPKVLELTLNNGLDPQTGKQLGLQTGTLETYSSYSELLGAFQKQVNHFIALKIKGNNLIERIFAKHLPAPFLSLIIDDCIAQGKDYNAGGARYNTTYIQGVGLGSVTDSLASINFHLFENKSFEKVTLSKALAANFNGFEQLRFDLIYNTPKYGNNDDRADDRLKEVFEIYYEAVNGKPNARGGEHRVNLLPTTCHVYFGSVIGALPEGRKAGAPLSEGISPVQGADTKGPAAVILSASKIDHLRTGGTLLNQKLTPSFFENESAIKKVSSLVRSYFRMDGHHIQFNVVKAETLRKAQKHPENYKDLIVRVAGYSDYFNDLGEDLQEEVIMRTEHESFS